MYFVYLTYNAVQLTIFVVQLTIFVAFFTVCIVNLVKRQKLSDKIEIFVTVNFTRQLLCENYGTFGNFYSNFGFINRICSDKYFLLLLLISRALLF